MTRDLTRRDLLRTAGITVAAAALDSRVSVAGAAETGAGDPASMGTLSAYMAGAATRDLPAPVVEKTKHHILDTFAAMVSGADLPPGQIAIKMARAHSGERVATVAGSDVVCGPMEAALANGMLAHSDETDDSHAPSQSHPGCAVVPAAYAVGEQFAIGGTRFLRAVALGYDVGPRVMMALGGLRYQMATHHSAHKIAGDFGAAAGAASAAGLNTQQMRWALDYAAQQASGIAAWQRDTEHVEKSLVFGGLAARNGVTSALLIHLGGSGVEDVFSGDDNFFLAYGAPTSNPGMVVEKLGERFEVMRTNIKKWTVGSPIQAPLDALENMRKKRSFDASQVRSVVVRIATSEAKTVNNREMPDVSLQHMIAVMLLDKTASFASAHDTARMKDPAVLRERAKVQLAPDEALEALYPRREAIVEVTLIDGTTLTERVGAVRGTSDNPMTRDEVVAKSRELLAPTVGAANATKLIDTVLNIERQTDIRQLRPLLQRKVR
jgi:2-methylcitrate dehydratase PrpD